jgi:hypothetical protein
VNNPHLCIQLAASGLTFAAESLENADDRPAEIQAIKLALAGIEGARLMLRRHARALQHTSAAFECGQLRGLEDDLTKRLTELTAREQQVAS